jgi:cytochrome c oxidase subunit IV
MERDDIYEYSLDHISTEEEGKSVRKKIWKVFWILLAVTFVEVAIGFKFSRVPEMKFFLISFFIFLTIVKAYYIVMSYMHLGDENKQFRYTVLVPTILFIVYLIFISLTEANYVFEVIKTWGS